jgi:MAF protein
VDSDKQSERFRQLDLNLAAISDSRVNSRFVTEDAQVPPLILASSSPRRIELLGKISYPFRVVSSGVDEDTVGGLTPAAAAAILANRKARAAAKTTGNGLVLAADTVIDFQGRMLGKPKHHSDAVEMLRLLRGRNHHVVTGIAILNKKRDIQFVSVVSTEIWMRDYSDLEIDDYIRTGEPQDKAGSYAIQGRGGRLIQAINGCYNNVVGLPLCETVELMRSVGAIICREVSCQMPSGSPCPRLS